MSQYLMRIVPEVGPELLAECTKRATVVRPDDSEAEFRDRKLAVQAALEACHLARQLGRPVRALVSAAGAPVASVIEPDQLDDGQVWVCDVTREKLTQPPYRFKRIAGAPGYLVNLCDRCERSAKSLTAKEAEGAPHPRAELCEECLSLTRRKSLPSS